MEQKDWKKQCSKCKQFWTLKHFTKKRKDSDELRSACKSCYRAYDREYAKTEVYKERKRRQMKAYRQTEHGKLMTSIRNKRRYHYKRMWKVQRWFSKFKQKHELESF